MKLRDDIRNVAIIAHVDHGKTTLVNEMLKQSDTLDEHTEIGDRALDSNALEKERGLRSFPRTRPLSTKTSRLTSLIPQGTLTLVVKLSEL